MGRMFAFLFFIRRHICEKTCAIVTFVILGKRRHSIERRMSKERRKSKDKKSKEHKKLRGMQDRKKEKNHWKDSSRRK